MGRIAERSASFAGVSTRVLQIAGEGPPILLLHGYSDSADTWRAVLRLLEGEQAAIAVDLPGFGRASRPAAGPLLPVIDAFVAELVRAHATEGPVVLSGNSLGAVAALRAAHDPTLPLAGIAPISPAGLGHAPWVDMIARQPAIHRILAVRLPLPSYLIRRAAAAAYARLGCADPARADQEAVHLYASHFRTAADIRRIVAGAWTLLAELGEGYAALETIACPVMMIWGERDVLVPISGARRVLEAVPGSRLETLAGVGHCAQVEDPARIAQLLVDFQHECQARIGSAA